MKGFPWSAVELSLCGFDLTGGNVSEVSSLGKILPDQHVGILVRAPFPGTPRMGEIHLYASS